MKKLGYIALSLIAALSFCLTGCMNTSAANTTFGLSPEKPWKTYHETLVYDYERVSAGGEKLLSGTYTVDIIPNASYTEIKSSFVVLDESGAPVDTVTSSVTMDPSSLYPKKSVKTVSDKEGGNGYSVTVDYDNKTSSIRYDKTPDKEVKPIKVPEVGQDTFDNEQFYWIIRSANNIGESDNTGTFSMVSGYDSYIFGSLKTYSMRYTVGESNNVVCSALAGKFGVGTDGRIPCKSVTGEIASDRTGSKTTFYFTVNDFVDGGAHVLVKFERPSYDLNSLQLTYNQTFTLRSYTAL